MVKFSFFTVRSKCCKKSKFVVLFLFFFLCWICNFQILYILRLRFFFVFFYAVHSDYCCLLPSNNVSVERSFSTLRVPFSFSFLPVSFLNLTLTSYYLPKKIFLRQQSPTANISQKKKKKIPRRRRNATERRASHASNSSVTLAFRNNERKRRMSACRHDKPTHDPNKRENFEILTRGDPADSSSLAHTQKQKRPVLSLSHYARKRKTPRNRDKRPRRRRQPDIDRPWMSSARREKTENVEIRKHDILLVFWWFFLDLERL